MTEPQSPYGADQPSDANQPPSFEPPSFATEPPSYASDQAPVYDAGQPLPPPVPPYGGPPPNYGPPPQNYGPPPGYAAPPYGMSPTYMGINPYPQPGAPFGVDAYGRPLSDKSKLTAGLLQLFLGAFGVGRFYLGYTGLGVAQIAVTWLTCGFGAIWPLIDAIMMLTDKVPDAQGRTLRE